jgi:Kdo2-lipid IVA lauroyltransferase/acyltransferase
LPADFAMHQCVDYLVYLVVRLFVCAVQTLSLEACDRVAHWLAWLACDVIGVRRRVIDENLSRAFPQLTASERTVLARRMWQHLFLMVAEIAHAPRKIHDTNWREYIRFHNQAAMMRLLWADRPKVFVSGHYGNFELASYTMGLFGFPTYAVARPLDNQFLDRFVKRFREAKGQHILPKQGSADEIAELLANNRTLSVLGDQHAGPKGCWVNFFGAAASTHKAIALFALSNNAPLAVGYARRTGGPLSYEMGVEAIVEPAELSTEVRGIAELTQWFTAVLEGLVRRDPAQYWWVHRRWKGGPPMRAVKAQAA